ncbi:MAG: hypothetical protein QY330_01850 [Candidatus Dojkabacteria bacterium]|uniref:Uncharacterized protein n=2 Tax=Candidatus Dojkabacteria TaxID=74243 RepID=A0A136KEZ9_9BACT|nr:MAG: hypothetical protein UZ20_WS6002001043 [candidate division WS6 bacterium OLB21]MBW7953184.1 hypothetical protein [Candidatus Dojkabacteria bacterium]WKZ28331.1 MAG: hypothetical protein QY330_01850 [Candidatus Dojkabacteria bacterium]
MRNQSAPIIAFVLSLILAIYAVTSYIIALENQNLADRIAGDNNNSSEKLINSNAEESVFYHSLSGKVISISSNSDLLSKSSDPDKIDQAEAIFTDLTIESEDGLETIKVEKNNPDSLGNLYIIDCAQVEKENCEFSEQIINASEQTLVEMRLGVFPGIRLASVDELKIGEHLLVIVSRKETLNMNDYKFIIKRS